MRYFFFLLAFFLSTQIVMCQVNDIDYLLIKQKQNISYSADTYYSGSQNSQKRMKIKRTGILSKVNPVITIPSGAMWLYQNFLSPQLARECPYEMTCSNFSKHAIEENGVIKGVLISADRLMRCNPFSLADVNEDYVNPINQKIIDFPCWYK